MKMNVLSQLNDLLEQRRTEIPKLRSKGQKVFGYVCCKVPVEIVHALGMIPIRIGVAAEAKMATGKEFTHQFTCPYIKCIVGEMLEQGDFFHDNVDVISGFVTCLTVHRCLEVLKQYTGKTTFYLTHPLNPPTKREEKFYMAEIAHFVSQLEAASGKKLDNTRLKESVEIFNWIRAKLRELCRLHSMNCSGLRWSEILKIIQAGFLLDAKQYLAFLMETVRKIEAEKEELQDANGAPRIMLLGSPMLPDDDMLIKVIEDCGAGIVADTLCTGMRTFEDLVISEPTIAGIAQTYLNSNPCASAQDLEIEKDRRLNHTLRLIREHKVQGAVYYALRFCDHYAFKDDETKQKAVFGRKSRNTHDINPL